MGSTNKKRGKFICNDESIELEGAFGFLCLGLHYLWNEDKQMLELNAFILPRVDLVHHACAGASLYYDMFMVPVKDVYAKGGGHYAKNHGDELPIINYDMLKIPQTLEVAVSETFWGTEKRLVPIDWMNGLHTVNRCCSAFCIKFLDAYTELYGCMLDFDPETEEGTAVGFDSLGKIVRYNRDTHIDKLYAGIIGESQHYSDEYYERCQELGFLNFSYKETSGRKRTYEFTPVWPEA